MNRNSYYNNRNIMAYGKYRCASQKSREIGAEKAAEAVAQKVVCVETGVEYKSAADAGREIGISRQCIHYSIKTGKKSRGFTFKKVN